MLFVRFAAVAAISGWASWTLASGALDVDLGPAFGGGTELILEVRTDAMLRAAIWDDIDALRYLAREAGHPDAGMRLARAEPTLLVEEAAGLDAIVASYGAGYVDAGDRVVGGVRYRAWALSSERAAEIEAGAFARSLATIRERVDELDQPVRSVEPLGDREIRVRLDL